MHKSLFVPLICLYFATISIVFALYVLQSYFCPFDAFSKQCSLLHMPFICIIGLLSNLYAFSCPRSPLYFSCRCIKAYLYPSDAFGWPQSSLYSPFMCIKALFYSLCAFSWLCSLLNDLQFICIKALFGFSEAFSWSPFLLNMPFICIMALLYLSCLYLATFSVEIAFYINHSSFLPLPDLSLATVSIVSSLYMCSGPSWNSGPSWELGTKRLSAHLGTFLSIFGPFRNPHETKSCCPSLKCKETVNGTMFSPHFA